MLEAGKRAVAVVPAPATLSRRSEPPCSVQLVVAEGSGGARLGVTDSGPGIPPDRREAVFDRFVRLEGSRSTPGNGLGLSLVR